MLGIPLKDSVLEGFSFLKHLFQAKDEAVRHMANPNSSTERFLREPGQRAMDRTNYRYERLIQNLIEDGHDYLREIPDFTGEFEPERADTLPDGTIFDNGLRRTYRYERFSARSGLMENVYVRPADIDYTHSDYDWYHPLGYRRFVWTDERGEPLPPFNHMNGTSTGRSRYLWVQPSDLQLIDEDQEWQNVRSRFIRPRDTDVPVIQYLSKPDGAAIGDTLSSQPILQLDGESIIVDAVARVQDQFGDTVAAEMIAPEYSSEKLKNLLNERKYLVTWDASGHGDVELISREDFLSRPGKPVLRKPLRVSEESDYGWGPHGPAEWPGHGLDMYGYPIPGHNGTSPTYSSLLSTVTPSIGTTYLSTDYTTRTHYVNFTTSYESTEYSTRTHVVDLTTLYESTALSTHFVTAPMSAPTTLATIGR
ncbi:hypothetical protein HII31_11169 [Pseudocercospora fuligena]|uniref:Uncharacterized protein n=1 Tax=Pseudocercospora fuligena TaxID=685502 RepID=A0A8H6R921_9PEZI|nr:hypothetical protein HII31_11169 [Pseudocercospora fuligena]